MSPRLGWAVIGAAALALEAVALLDQARHHKSRAQSFTLTATAAGICRTDTPAGAWAFRAGWQLLSDWLPGHMAAPQ